MGNFLYTEVVDGVNVLFTPSGINYIYVNLSNIEKCIKVSNTEKIYNFKLDSYEGFNGEDINFLKHFKFVKRLILRSLSIKDISYIYRLNQLEKLNISMVGDIKIDLLKLPSLIGLSSDSKYILNLDKCQKLEEIGISFSKKYPLYSLVELESLVNLKELSFTGSQIQSLKGIKTFKKLKVSIIERNRELKDISDLTYLKESLEILILEKNKSISSYEPIGRLNKLKKLMLSDCGSIDSLGFIKNLEELEFISFVDTNILDGNMTPLLNKNLSHVGFNDKKHYNLKCDYIVQYNKS